MKKKLVLLSVLCLFGLVADGTIDLNLLFNYANQPVPNYINEDNTPNNNAINDETATLGRVLFYDTNLSLNNSISCASCHKQELAFGDDRIQSVGFDGGLTGRHSMRLVNARFGDEERFFWDERANSLEAQSTQPIQDHIEMGFSGENGQPGLDSLIGKLSGLSYYTELFDFAFGDTNITEQRMQFALAQFVRSIQSFDSRFDQGLAQTNDLDDPFPNFTQQENMGKALYLNNNGAGCQRCHQAPEFDIAQNRDNNGIVGVIGDPNAVDLNNTRSPSLRDLFGPDGTLNGPLMHTGEFQSIADVIDHYDDIEVHPLNNNIDNRLVENNGDGENLNLSDNEKLALEAFLRTLTGNDIYSNEKWSDPFDENGNLELIGGTVFADNDLDGFASDVDCNDFDASINPGMQEVPNNSIDENCDGVAEVIDSDQDGYHSGLDCNDNDPTVNPAMAEIPNNEIDENCDGIIAVDLCEGAGGDADGDGICADADCNDNDASVGASTDDAPICDDGDCSNGLETWDGCNCIAGTAPSTVCNDGDECTTDTFSLVDCTCVFEPVANCGEEAASLGDFVYQDLNANGIYDPNEPGLPGVEVTLFDSDGAAVASGVTDQSGNYIISEIVAGEFYAMLHPPAEYGASITTPMLDVTAGHNVLDLNIGFAPPMLPCEGLGLIVEQTCDDASGLVNIIAVIINGTAPFMINGDYVDPALSANSFSFDVAAGQVNVSLNVVDAEGCSATLQEAVQDCVTVAIELTSFQGEVLDHGNLLSWSTASEYQSDLFEILRSSDGLVFEKIAEVNAAGYSESTRQYAFLDEQLRAHKNYYQLVELSESGRRTSSEVILLERGLLTLESPILYPIPARDQLRIRFDVRQEQEVELAVFGIAGNLVQSQRQSAAKGANVYQMSLADFASGVYILQISLNEESVSTRFVKE